MRKQFILLTFFVLLSGQFSAQAQLPKASDYFPLKVGNAWQYVGDYGVINFFIASDTLLGDSLKIYKALVSPPRSGISTYYYYYNSDSTVVYKNNTFPDEIYSSVPILDTRVAIGDKWTYSCDPGKCAFAILETAAAEFFGLDRNYVDVHEVDANIDSLTVRDRSFRYADGFGLVQSTHKDSTNYSVFAKINGIEYGTLVSVANEQEAPAAVPRKLSLHIHPNPISNYATISVTHAGRASADIKIVDILGRTVRNLSLQSTSETAQIHWNGRDDAGRLLPNGIYFIVAISDHHFSSHKILFFK